MLKKQVEQGKKGRNAKVPKISSAYQRTTYKFRAREPPIPSRDNRTPTELEIRSAIRSQLPVFGYNCEKRNAGSMLGHWSSASPKDSR